MTERSYATVKHPTIEALVHGLYKYIDHKDALGRLENIRANFVMSKDAPESSKDHPMAVFWIKGYALTDAEIEKGFTGHFCRMEITTNAKGQFTLGATKVEVPLDKHPQKKRKPAAHPNWGHPVMRSVKKGKVYTTLEAAAAELELLHLEFPEVSIPGVNKLYLIIYEKREGVKQPTRKIALELVAKDGGFAIQWKDNEKKTLAPASKQPPSAAVAAEAPQVQVGSFTANELLRQRKRAMKQKKPAPRAGTPGSEKPGGQ